MHLIFYIVMSVLLIGVPAVQAQELEKQIAQAAKYIDEDIQALTKDLDEPSRDHFMLIYNNHNLLSVVDIIEADVGKAITACSETNPEIKDKMVARYKDWQAQLAPIKDEAFGHLDNMILVQNYADRKAILDVLGQSDNLRALTNSRFEKVPVSERKACDNLYDKMQDTQEELTTLLRQSMVILPRETQQKYDESRAE